MSDCQRCPSLTPRVVIFGPRLRVGQTTQTLYIRADASGQPSARGSHRYAISNHAHRFALSVPPLPCLGINDEFDASIGEAAGGGLVIP